MLKYIIILQMINILKSDPIIIKPKNYQKDFQNILIIIIQGALIPNKEYIPLTNEISKNFQYKNVFFGLPSFTGDMPNPLQFSSKVENVVNLVKNSNLSKNKENLNKNIFDFLKKSPVFHKIKKYWKKKFLKKQVKKSSRIKNLLKGEELENLEVFIVAHSLGTVILQDYLQKNEIGVKGGVVMGGPILRKYRRIKENGLSSFLFSLPILTIGAELDGLSSNSRFGESFWHMRNLVKKENYEKNINILEEAYMNFPHVYIEGMNHSQFANGYLSYFLKRNDLRSEITNKEATEKTGEIINTFIKKILQKTKKNQKIKIDYENSKKNLLKKISETEEYILPLINLLEFSGNMNLKPPCNGHELINEKKDTCFHGSKVGEIGQKIMSGFINEKNINIETDDNFHRVYSVNPVHLPTILNFCEKKKSFKNKIMEKINSDECVLKTITVSQPVNVTGDVLDLGTYSNTAYEIRTKLVSRQNSFYHANLDYSNFNKLDEISTCGEINKKMLEIAMGSFNSKIMTRFEIYGQKLLIGEDLGPYNAGPLWIWKDLNYSEVLNENGKYDILIKAPMMRTPVDYLIKSAAGFHYCKILSPDYIAEWVYGRGLKKYYGINQD